MSNCKCQGNSDFILMLSTLFPIFIVMIIIDGRTRHLTYTKVSQCTKWRRVLVIVDTLHRFSDLHLDNVYFI
jgi:hypothetical protein